MRKGVHNSLGLAGGTHREAVKGEGGGTSGSGGGWGHEYTWATLDDREEEGPGQN